MKYLFVGLHRPARSPSQRVRMEQFLPALQARGHTVHYRWLLDARDDEVFYASGHYAQKGLLVLRATARAFSRTFEAYDRVFVQREMFFLGGPWFERLLRTQKLIYDFDDAVWIRDVSEGNRLFAPLKNAGKPAQLMAMAHTVLAGNHYLAEYARQFNDHVYVVPTVVDTDLLTPPAQRGVFTVGWMGSPSTSRYIRPLMSLVHRAVGDASIGEAWSERSEVSALQSFHVGLMPLTDDPWSRGKCGFKALQYMAVGAVPVVSPYGVNSDIVTHRVTGMHATTMPEWRDAIAELRASPELRQRLAVAARAEVVAKWSLAAWRDQWLALVE